MVLAKRKDEKWRFCVDYRKLNSFTEDVAQPIPRIADSMKDVAKAKVFSTLDLKSGYWQVRMEEQAKSYMAFFTPTGGTYQFKVMPFGLKGAPGTFVRLISQEVLKTGKITCTTFPWYSSDLVTMNLRVLQTNVDLE